MSAHATPPLLGRPEAGRGAPPLGRGRRPRRARSTSLTSHGEPMVWVTGGALGTCIAMIAGLLLVVGAAGFSTFWPQPVVRVETAGGTVLMGEVTRRADAVDAQGHALPEGAPGRRLVRTGNFELTGEHFAWVDDADVVAEARPEWALVLERLAWGRFYGVPAGFERAGERVLCPPAQAWAFFEEHHEGVRERWERRRAIETDDVGAVNHELEADRLAVRRVELEHGAGSPQARAAARAFDERRQELQAEYAVLTDRIAALDAENEGYRLLMDIAGGERLAIGLADVVRAYPANQLGALGKAGVYVSRWWEFLSDDPREANSEGGVFPAIFGTVIMTLVMTLLVVPFGVLAALYLREYAKQGLVTSAVRVAVNNLAGVPSIVFGVFGLGFFCYILGDRIDVWFFPELAPAPTFGTGGILWASLTLALLTLPVVIVATEEALAAVPGSMREGSYACGASKWQTIRRIVLPRATPGIMTGAILALARGAGEVAPLMLVGAAKLAPDLAVDGTWPFVHLERSFMHLGFHIYDLGFQSQNSEAAKPMVFTTTLLLIAIVVALNIVAIATRTRLRARFVTGKF